MELKDVVLSTLAELEADVRKEEKTSANRSNEKAFEVKEKLDIKKEQKKEVPAEGKKTVTNSTAEDELKFLESLKERTLVLFEGFQSPNNKEIEAKIDITLNFLEYLLATTESRIDKIKGK